MVWWYFGHLSSSKRSERDSQIFTTKRTKAKHKQHIMAPLSVVQYDHHDASDCDMIYNRGWKQQVKQSIPLFETAIQWIEKKKNKNSKRKRPTRAKKSVAFDQNVTVHYSLHINDYSHEEKQACWQDSAEKKSTHEEISHVRHLIESDVLEQGKQQELPRRGIETRREQAQRRHQMMMCVDAVIDEQELQWDEGFSDPEQIALMYKMSYYSSSVVARARAIALKDHLEVVADMSRSTR